ncbi:MAG: TlpA family protein disulfide reductase [Fibrobacterales bacterium]
MCRVLLKSMVLVVLLNVTLLFAEIETVPFWNDQFTQLHTQGTLSPQQIEGDLIIIEFWASWCVPCRAALPSVDSLSSSSIGVFAMSLDESFGDAQTFYRSVGVNTILVHDPSKMSAQSLNIEGMPTLLICNRKGEILRRWDGYGLSDKKYILEMIARELETLEEFTKILITQ